MDIRETVKKVDYAEKVQGQAQYVADMEMPGMLHGAMVRATIAHGIIREVQAPPLPEGYLYVDARDIPGKNRLKVIGDEQPVFADEKVCFQGEALGMVVGPDCRLVHQLAARFQVEYEALPAIFSIEQSQTPLVDYRYSHGPVEECFQKAASVYEETFYTGYQEQAYLEPQGMIGYVYPEGDKVTVWGSMQCPYYVRDAVAHMMGMEGSQVQIIQTTTGGGFGGKEDFPSLLACQVAVAALKAGHPVQVIFNRREDMAVTTKRHPARLHYRAALDENGNLTALDTEIDLDGGAYEGLSSVVLQRALIAAAGVYRLKGLQVHGRVMETNTVPTGAFRGFGAPQSFFGVELLMEHLARFTSRDSLSYRLSHMVEQFDPTATRGEFRYPIIMTQMVERVLTLSDYEKKKALYADQRGRYRRGIGISLFLHGCGFTGSAEKDFIRSVLRLARYEDDTYEILASNTDMGQGLKTTFSKIAAQVLEVPISRIRIVNPDTDRVPNSGPTVASRSLMVVGKLVERAARQMKEEEQPGKAHMVEVHYQHPDMIPWELSTFTGDAYPTYSWGVNGVEVEVDTLTGQTTLQGVWAVFDVGRPIDASIMKGQMDGGMLQAIGYGSMERMVSREGRIPQASMTDYLIPTAMDTIPFVTETMDNLYDGGPFGAKGAGELTIIGGAPAYAMAVEMAIKRPLSAIPITPETILEALEERK